MDKTLKQGQISSAISAQDQLVITYRKPDDDQVVVRFVTPIVLDGDMVHCSQHLPEEGFRNFKLDRIDFMQRVISRACFPNVYQKEATQA